MAQDPARQAVTCVPWVSARTLSKHELQYTGRSARGANGTTAWLPHDAQIAT
jgi:hypothetical protein